MVVVFGDAELVTITRLRATVTAGHVCSEPPGPDELEALMPVLMVQRLPSPPMANRFALDVARMDITARAWDRPAAIELASQAGAAIRSMGGLTIADITVSTVRRMTGPEVRPDPGIGRVAGFTCELFLRPLS
ncbi:hypothetical protein GCM10027294_43790 [Marinactinospora endophytica]